MPEVIDIDAGPAHDRGLIIPDRRPAIPGGGPQSVADVIDRIVARTPDAPALIGASGRLTYRELDLAANRAANALAGIGVRAGDRVGAALPNDVDIIVTFLGAMRLGAMWVGIPRVLAPAEKAFVSRDAELSILLADPEVAAQVRAAPADFWPAMRCVEIGPIGLLTEWRQLVEGADEARPTTAVDPFAPAAISYTSGTTGRPKGVVHSQHNLLMPGAVTVAQGEFPPHGPLGTSAPFTILNVLVLVPVTAFQAGAPAVMIDSNRPGDVAGWIEREQIMHMVAVPTVYHDLLASPDVAPHQLASLLRPRSGGAAVTESLRARWLARFGRPLTSSLALTEGPTFVSRESTSTPRVEGSLGTAVAHVEISIVDEHDHPLPPGEPGEICVAAATSGPWAGVYTPMLGYWGRSEETLAALRGGRLHTGDIGRLDTAGNLYLVDRKNALIIRGGSNIYPAEVERVLDLDPRVAECALVARPDERLGERTVAFVELERGATVAPGELERHCGAHLAAYKVPDEIRVVDAMPRSPLGKVQRSTLSEWAAE